MMLIAHAVRLAERDSWEPPSIPSHPLAGVAASHLSGFLKVNRPPADAGSILQPLTTGEGESSVMQPIYIVAAIHMCRSSP